MTYRELLEKKNIDKEVIKLLKRSKDGVMCINSEEILVNFTDYDDGYFYGMDQFDNDVEEENLNGYRLDK